MAEIRRITEGEGERVAALWEEQNRTSLDDGPLTECGRRNIARMLDIAAWAPRRAVLSGFGG